MDKFKKGDVVIRIINDHEGGMKVGDISTVEKICDYGALELKGWNPGTNCIFSENLFKLAQTSWRKHYEAKK